MDIIKILESEIDESVNIIKSSVDGGYYEARFVQRNEDTFIIYLSSMSGCDKICRFCHLTQTNQLMTNGATFRNYLDQTKSVLDISKDIVDQDKIRNVHVNFMARGDLLNNQEFLSNPHRLITSLELLIRTYYPDAVAKFKLSTIFPRDTGPVGNQSPLHFVDLFVESINDLRELDNKDVEIYYSLYSLKESFRKKWIPKSISPNDVGNILRGTHDGLRLHHALIAGQNDSEEDVRLIHQWLEEFDLEVMVNIVRYNPFDDKSGVESSDEMRVQYIEWMKQSPRVKLVQEISFRGKDVYASCGMFVS